MLKQIGMTASVLITRIPNTDNVKVMKKFLKFFGVFILGAVLGTGITFVLASNYFTEYYTHNFAEHTVFDISVDIEKLQYYRRRTERGERFYKMLETSIPGHILEIEKNEKLKKSSMYKFLLSGAKEFYTCTETRVPKEIEGIISNVDLGKDFECESELNKNNKKIGEEK